MKYIFIFVTCLTLIFSTLGADAAVTLFDFEDGTTQGWENDITEYFVDNLGEPSTSMDEAYEGSYSLVYPLDLNVKHLPYNVINDLAFVRFPSTMDFTKGDGMAVYVYIPGNANISGATPATASVYIKTGENWAWFESNESENIVPGVWVKTEIDFSLSRDASSTMNQQVADLDEVHEVGVHLSGAQISGGQTSFYVDMFEVQGALVMTDVTVTVEGVLTSVRLSGSIDFGSVGLGEEAVSDEPLIIENIGNLPLTISLSIIDPEGWTSVNTFPGYNTYVLNSIFNSLQAQHEDFNEEQHALAVAPRRSSTVVFAGNQNGINVQPGEVRSLWFEFRAPEGTNVATQQRIKLIVSIEVADEYTLGISVNSKSYNFGPLSVGTTAVSSAPVAITNTGTVSQTYWMRLIEPQNWTHSQKVPGNNVYVLNAAFDTDGDVNWENVQHALGTSLMSCDQTKFSGDSSGSGVPVGNQRDLWFQIKMPINTSDASPQNIRVVFVASQS
ncbi:MAG: hypothetical protein ABH868_07735 [bacterium]